MGISVKNIVRAWGVTIQRRGAIFGKRGWKTLRYSNNVFAISHYITFNIKSRKNV